MIITCILYTQQADCGLFSADSFRLFFYVLVRIRCTMAKGQPPRRLYQLFIHGTQFVLKPVDAGRTAYAFASHPRRLAPSQTSSIVFWYQVEES